MVFPNTVSKAWYSLINLLKHYSLTFINRTRHDKVVETGVMGGGIKRLTYQKVVMDGMLKVRITFDNLRYLTIFVETKKETMTPKEKAKELYDKYTGKMNTILDCSYPYSSVDGVDLCAKELLVIAVDEMINDCDASSPFEEKRLIYWQEVRAGIGSI